MINKFTIFITLMMKSSVDTITSKLVSMGYTVAPAFTDGRLIVNADTDNHNNACTLVLIRISKKNAIVSEVKKDFRLLIKQNKIKFYSASIENESGTHYLLGNIWFKNKNKKKISSKENKECKIIPFPTKKNDNETN